MRAQLASSSGVLVLKQTLVQLSGPRSRLALRKKKDVDKLVFLFIMSDLCEVGSDAELSVLLASVAAPAEGRIAVAKLAPAGRIVALKQQYHAYAVVVLPKQRKGGTGRGCLCLTAGKSCSSSCSCWRLFWKSHQLS